jgi:hypothetical protein
MLISMLQIGILLLESAFFALFGIMDQSADLSQKGLVTYVEGTAKKAKIQQIEWTNISKNSEVVGGDRVRTFAESRAELEIARLDRIRMAPKTTIDILKLYEESKQQVRESKILLQSGDLWANVAKKTENMKLNISTPVAAAAITGTTLRLSVAADSSAELKVYKGEVVLSNAPQDKKLVPKSIQPSQIEGPHQIAGPHEVSIQEWSLIVKSMQRVRINKSGQVTQSGNFSANDKDETSDWVKWNQQMDTKGQ